MTRGAHPEHVQRLLDSAPLLTETQRERLSALLRPSTCPAHSEGAPASAPFATTAETTEEPRDHRQHQRDSGRGRRPAA